MTARAWAIVLAACALLLTTPAQAAVFVANSTVDSVDALPGDGVCADASGGCTLRAAVMGTYALVGADVINVPAGTYVLTIPGTGENAAATGDLDVADDLTLLGAGAETTIIDANGIDRVLSVMQASLSVHSLTITGGLVRREGHPPRGLLPRAGDSGAAGLRGRPEPPLHAAHARAHGYRRLLLARPSPLPSTCRSAASGPERPPSSELPYRGDHLLRGGHEGILGDRT